VLDYESMARAAAGCQVIIHHATVYKTWARNPDDILRPALEGTRNIFRAAAETGAERLVYTSSAAAVGSEKEPGKLRDESFWNEEPH
jgi:dihydroflavonol-4-reductase